MGEQRSGTTLLLQTLQASGDVTIFAGGLGRLLEHAWRWRLDPWQPLTQRQRHVLLQSVRVPWGMVVKQPKLDLGVEGFQSFAELLQIAFERSAPHTPISGHKVHGPPELLPTILRVEPVRVIYIVRDVRDVVLSRWYRGQELIDFYAVRWRDAVRCVRALEAPQERLHVLRFEDLVADPATELGKIRSFIGAAPQPFDVHIPVERFNTSFGDLTTPFDDRAVGRWRSHWDEGPIRYAGWLCRPELDALGYDTTPAGSLTVRERRVFASRRVRVDSLRAAAAMRDRLLRLVLPAWG